MASPAHSATLGVIGLGYVYVGLPVAAATARSGFQTIGFDIDTEKIGQLNRGCSYIRGQRAARPTTALCRHFELQRT
jgi:UDP-N-acetyl-D-mannosaminuronate dehydrogenase